MGHWYCNRFLDNWRWFDMSCYFNKVLFLCNQMQQINWFKVFFNSLTRSRIISSGSYFMELFILWFLISIIFFLVLSFEFTYNKPKSFLTRNINVQAPWNMTLNKSYKFFSPLWIFKTSWSTMSRRKSCFNFLLSQNGLMLKTCLVSVLKPNL